MADMPKRDLVDRARTLSAPLSAEFMANPASRILVQQTLIECVKEIERLRSIIAAQTEGDDETPEGYGRDPHTMEDGE